MIIHNIIPNRERLFRMNKVPNSLCPVDFINQDNVHFFCQCQDVLEAWTWIKNTASFHINNPFWQIQDKELLFFTFPTSAYEKEILWLVSSYCDFRWNAHRQGRKVNIAKLK